ncbi:hypothetical protein VPG01_015 [Vibrio phage VPG01]|nr:hypothetical protein VPG01_015 [Vibrio phage VPG01]
MKLEYTMTPKFKCAVRELRNTLKERRALFEKLEKDFYEEVSKYRIELYGLAQKFLKNRVEINKQRPVKWGLFKLNTRYETYTVEDFDEEKAIEALKPHTVNPISRDAFVCNLYWEEPKLEKYDIPGVCYVDANMSYANARSNNRYREYIGGARNPRQLSICFTNIPPTYRLVPQVSEHRIEQLTKILECQSDRLIFEEKEINALIRLGLKL